MSIKIFNVANDNVINSFVGLGVSTYEYALDRVYPLINRFEAQRKFLDTKFYERLERDILRGCLMPPVTLAFVRPDINIDSPAQLTEFVEDNIDSGYILDGIQRLSTLRRASNDAGFNATKEIFFNVIVADSKDKLLYRMITLNNGQKGMTPRHQIEILTQELFDFSTYKVPVQTEKEKSEKPIKGAFSVGDISKGYIAFLTANVHNENSKIIDEKMDQILIGRILDTDIADSPLEFDDILHFVDDKSAEDSYIREWFQVANNFIGFSVGIKKSYEYIFAKSTEELRNALENFDIAFKAINTSKINIGKYKRELAKYFFENAEKLFNQNAEYLTESFFEETVTE